MYIVEQQNSAQLIDLVDLYRVCEASGWFPRRSVDHYRSDASLPGPDHEVSDGVHHAIHIESF